MQNPVGNSLRAAKEPMFSSPQLSLFFFSLSVKVTAPGVWRKRMHCILQCTFTTQEGRKELAEHGGRQVGYVGEKWREEGQGEDRRFGVVTWLVQ